MKEVCACGASFKYDRAGAALADDRLERAYEMLKDWRENHRHEMPPTELLGEETPPEIFESQGSAMERAWAPESESRPTVQLGFQRC